MAALIIGWLAGCAIFSHMNSAVLLVDRRPGLAALAALIGLADLGSAAWLFQYFF